MTMKMTSITDQPITTKADESLDVVDYSQAMVDFIRDCSTPLTVGIQGEWGSGKTSMMNIIRNDLVEQNVGVAWVNTWEYSMFREPVEIVPAVMRGLLENLRQECEELGNWPKALSDTLDKVAGFLKNIGKFAVDVGVKTATGKDGFTDSVSETGPSTARAEIAEIKKKIQSILDTLIADAANPYGKVVFFIDDLDRIEPAMAVAILEALKNMFDVQYCVFVLAIDYDVVVKGLESKFGPKTDENEREFRSFFDKIIQVPFSMPVSAYNIDKLIQNRFEQLGFVIDPKFQGAFKDVANYTVGANPRSIKRYINTFSLLKRIGDMKRDSDDKATGAEDFALFSLIGFQIAYPRIYQLIVKNPDFVHWDAVYAGRNDVEINIPKEYTENELFDEVWEQMVWSFCQRDTYLKVRVTSILNAMNMMHKLLGDDDLDEILANALQVANITSVDDDQEANQVKFRKVRLDGWESYAKAQVVRGIPRSIMDVFQHVHDTVSGEYQSDNVVINYAPRDMSFNADIPKRKKVFVYATPRKKSLRLALSGTGDTLDLTDAGQFDTAAQQAVRKSYDAIVNQ